MFMFSNYEYKFVNWKLSAKKTYFQHKKKLLVLYNLFTDFKND